MKTSVLYKKYLLAIPLAIFVAVSSPSRSIGADDPSPLDLARQLNEAFVGVADRVSKSVVVVEVAYKETQGQRIDSEESEELNPWLDKLPEGFRDFFIPDGSEGDAPRTESEGDTPSFQGSGSGVIIRKDGYILTNHHVVENADRIKIRLKDGREFDASIKGTDELSEVAVIKIDSETVSDLPAVTFADSDKVRVGEYAIAIGTPFALDYTVTIGHVSAKGRAAVVPWYMGGNNMDQNFIQTDANINPGNSGGPLVNLEGHVMGINTLIKGMGTGIGFAIPSNLARKVADQLIKTGTFERAWLGIGIKNIKDFENPDVFAPGQSFGMVVMSIPQGAPAYGSDLKASDVIVAVNGVAVKDIQTLRTQVRAQPLGSTLKLDIVRGTEELRVDVKTGKLPQGMLADNDRKMRRVPVVEPKPIPLGITVEPIDSPSANKFDIEAKQGVVVVEVEPGSPAAARGIKPGYVITDVNHQSVKSLDHYRELIRKAEISKGVLINFVDSAGNSSFEVIKK